jgi:hypothetical protein
VGGGWLLVLALLFVAVVADRLSGGSLLPPPDPVTGTSGAIAALRALPSEGRVLVAMDADLGTYPEIRPAVRAALADLARRGALLAFVSVSVEGRAIAVEEMARLGAAETPPRLLDFGFVSGAEAALVRLTDEAVVRDASGPEPSEGAAPPSAIGDFDMVMVVGGTDIGPRTWVEQVGTRLPELAMVAIAPTFARPELEPYLRTGQLTALLATVGDDAAFVRTLAADAPPSDRPAGGAALLAGVLVALLVIGRRLLGALPRLGVRQGPAVEADES